MSRARRPAIDRLMEKVVEHGGCWQFAGSLNQNGYGTVGNVPGSSVLAHRVTYEFFRSPIPAGLVIDHLCRNRACVNPWHLEPVDQWTNLLRGAQATQTHCRRAGHELTDENTYLQWMPRKRGGMCRSCIQCRRDANNRYAARKRLQAAA